MLLSYISANYAPYHTKVKTSVYYFSDKRNFNSFRQRRIAQLVDILFRYKTIVVVIIILTSWRDCKVMPQFQNEWSRSRLHKTLLVNRRGHRGMQGMQKLTYANN